MRCHRSLDSSAAVHCLHLSLPAPAWLGCNERAPSANANQSESLSPPAPGQTGASASASSPAPIQLAAVALGVCLISSPTVCAPDGCPAGRLCWFQRKQWTKWRISSRFVAADGNSWCLRLSGHLAINCNRNRAARAAQLNQGSSVLETRAVGRESGATSPTALSFA